MIEKVIATIEKYNMLNKGDGVVIGLSGGADSVSLLHSLYSLKERYDLKIYPVHINHSIRGEEAKRDEDFAVSLCEGLGLQCRVIKRDIPNEAKALGLSCEEAGRKARYEVFDTIIAETGSHKIAVAHNLNDNTETVLMRLCRGTGIRGLCGIAPVRDNIIRPLIQVSRKEIEDYCRENNLNYCTDSTNLETDYTRNKVRLELIPWLEQNLNPSLARGISKTAELMTQEEEFLEELTDEAYKKCLVVTTDFPLSKKTVGATGGHPPISDEKHKADENTEVADGVPPILENKENLTVESTVGATGGRPPISDEKERTLEVVLNCNTFNTLNLVLKRRVIRRVFSTYVKSLKDISAEHIDAVCELSLGKSGKSLSLPYNLRAIKIYDSLKIEQATALPNGFCYKLSLNEPVFIKELGLNVGIYQKKQEINEKILYTNRLKCDIIAGGLYFRSRQNGDKIYQSSIKGSKKVKKLLNEHKVPVNERDLLPMLACGDRVIWIYNIAYDNSCFDKNEGLYFYLWRNFNEGNC